MKILSKNNIELISKEDDEFPNALKSIQDCPKKLYLIGNPNALQEGLALVGARRATPYGLTCTKHFAEIAAKNNITIISGGAYGCDSAAHRAALKLGKPTVVFLGGGCNKLYPSRHARMFQEVIDKGGAVVSEQD